MKALVIQNIDIEGPGLLSRWLEAAGRQLDLRHPYRGDELPDDPRGWDALIILGGPMSVNDQDGYPYLRHVEELVRGAVARGMPVLGLCLGAQIMAKALGGRVMPNAVKEIGFYRVSLTPEGAADPLFDGLGPDLPVFHWHGETFSLPEDAVLLATAPDCPNQAFRYGENAYGLQFHLEVTWEMVASWADAYREELADFNGMSPAELVQSVAGHASELAEAARRVGANLARACAHPDCPFPR